MTSRPVLCARPVLQVLQDPTDPPDRLDKTDSRDNLDRPDSTDNRDCQAHPEMQEGTVSQDNPASLDSPDKTVSIENSHWAHHINVACFQSKT